MLTGNGGEITILHWIDLEQQHQSQTHRNTNVLSVRPGPPRWFHRCNQDKRAQTIVTELFGQENGLRLWLHTASNPNDSLKVKHAEMQIAAPSVCPEGYRSFHRCNQDKRKPSVAIIVDFDMQWGWDYDITLQRTPTTRPKSSTGTRTYCHFHFSCFLFAWIWNIKNCVRPYVKLLATKIQNRSTSKFVATYISLRERESRSTPQRAWSLHHFAPLPHQESMRNPRQPINLVSTNH